MSDSLLKTKSKAFAIRIIRLYKFLQESKREYIMSKQILRSGTSIGANIHEAFFGQSRKDFISKMHIALKEAAETEYWIEILTDTGYIGQAESKSVKTDCIELIKMLQATIKTTKSK